MSRARELDVFESETPPTDGGLMTDQSVMTDGLVSPISTYIQVHEVLYSYSMNAIVCQVPNMYLLVQ